MKKTLLYSAMALAATLTMSSCGDDFLVLEPVGAVQEPLLLSLGSDAVDYSLTKAYNCLYNYGRDAFATPFANYAYGDVFAGDANKGSEFADQSDFTEIETYSFNAGNGYIYTKWRYLYDGIKNANQAEHMANVAKEQGIIDDAYLTQVKAQVAFLRGLFHFEAVKMYGAAVPYVSYEDQETAVDPAVSNVDESGNYIYIWDKVLSDFDYAYQNLPETWANAQSGRVNKWAARAFYAKTLIYQASPYGGIENGANKTANWETAKGILADIIANGKDARGNKYQLAADYETLWTAGKSDWTGESVFDIQTAISGSQSGTNSLTGTSHIAMAGALGGGWGFFQPSVYLTSSMKVDANGLPVTKLGETMSEPEMIPDLDADGNQKKNPDTGDLLWKEIINTKLDIFADPRIDISVGRYGVPFWDWAVPAKVDGWIRSTGNGGYYLNKKYLPKRADKSNGLSLTSSTGSTVKNTHVMRVADLYLLYAECCIETGDLNTAYEYINKVRERAANKVLQTTGAESLYAAADLPVPTDYVFEDLFHGTTVKNTVGNYRLGPWPVSTSKEEAKAALIAERHMELSLEGHRWFDLARWGIAPEVINDFIAYESDYLVKYVGQNYNSKWMMFPIPNTEIVTMQGKLVQNAAWK